MMNLNGKLTSEANLIGELSVGGGGTSNYDALENKPQINGVELVGDKSLDDLGIDIPTKTSDLDNDSGYVNSSIVANPYDATSTYAVGAYVTHENNLYKCNTAITTAEEWNAEHWTLVDVISAIPTKTSELENDSGFVTLEDVIDDSVIANNKAYSSDKVEELIDSLLPVDTSSGAVASFSTDLAKPLVSLKADINAVQASGTPTPSTPIAISGWSEISLVHCGNKYKPNIKPFNEWEIARSDYYISRFSVPNTLITVNLIDKDTTVDLTGVAFGFVDSYWNKNNPITTNEYRWFIQNGTPQTTKKNVAIADASKILSGLIFSPQNEATYNKLMARYDYEFVFSETSDVEPYNTEVINLGDTIYGGYVTQDNNGLKLVVTHNIVKFNELTWGSGNWGSYPQFYTTLNDAKSNTVTSNLGGLVCEIYSEVTPSYMYSNPDTAICLNNKTISVRDSSFATKAEWEQATANYHFVYPLETPIEIDLTDIPPFTTLIGTNNIFADSGDIEVKYKESIQKYIDDKIAETQALIL